MITVTLTDAQARRILAMIMWRRTNDRSGVSIGTVASVEMHGLAATIQDALDNHRHKPGYTP